MLQVPREVGDRYGHPAAFGGGYHAGIEEALTVLLGVVGGDAHALGDGGHPRPSALGGDGTQEGDVLIGEARQGGLADVVLEVAPC